VYVRLEVQPPAFLTLARNKLRGQLHPPDTLPPGKRSRYPLDRRLGGLQSRSGHGGGEEDDPCPSRESNPGRSAHCLVTALSELPRVLFLNDILNSVILSVNLFIANTLLFVVDTACWAKMGERKKERKKERDAERREKLQVRR